MRRPVRIPSQLSDSLCRWLNAYAIAASAAGVGVLALVQPSEAKVIYTKTRKVVYGPSNYINIDLNHDGIVDFAVGINLWYIESQPPRLGLYYGNSTNTVRKNDSGAVAYPAGVRIGQKTRAAAPPKRGPGGERMEEGCSGYPLTCRGRWNWADVGNRYLGLTFLINGKTHYGWARLNASINQPGGGVFAILTGYAYETIPGKAIITGRTQGPDVITVQPASLGHLAAGASAIPAWRSGR
jgi:hypothetical protein